MSAKAESYLIPTVAGGAVECYKPGLTLVDFYRSPNPPPAIGEVVSKKDQPSKTEQRIFKKR